MSICKSSPGTKEFEFPGHELFTAIIRKFLYERVLAGHYRAEIEAGFARMYAPNLGVAGQVHHFRGIQKRFGWHTSPQDAQAADFLGALDNHNIKPLICGGSCS